jgi:hypothetical protein
MADDVFLGEVDEFDFFDAIENLDRVTQARLDAD